MIYSKNIASRINPAKMLLPVLILAILFIPVSLNAQDEKQAVIKLSFEQNDSTRICTATVTSDNKPIKEIEVHFYVQRMYSLLPIGKAVETDTNGNAVANYPLNLPGDKNGNFIAVAKIEDDENYGNVENRAEVKWGIFHESEEPWNARSLSASRDKAPMILIIVSNLIIAFIWGTILYVIYQVFRIRKESLMLKTKNK